MVPTEYLPLQLWYVPLQLEFQIVKGKLSIPLTKAVKSSVYAESSFV